MKVFFNLNLLSWFQGEWTLHDEYSLTTGHIILFVKEIFQLKLYLNNSSQNNAIDCALMGRKLQLVWH